MTLQESFFLTFHILGGLALFLLGMSIMTRGLRDAVGEQLRAILARGTRNRMSGLGMGTLLGFLAHSSATTVMTVGFLNAGLLTLVQSLPIFFGANIGTTLSMQLVSFRLTDFAYVAAAIGFFVQMMAPNAMVKHGGQALLGFGLLFLGMSEMSSAITPHREFFTQYLAAVDGSTWKGLLYGILLAALITGVVQSSGAIIGIAFALASAGVYTSLEQVFPIILGAHIGTTVTALAASIGGVRDARRGAVGNLCFNIFNVLLAIPLAPLLFWVIPLLTDDLVHQIAHLHTAVMVAAAVVLIPIVPQMASLLYRIIPVRDDENRNSHLDYTLLSIPEKAIQAAMRELGRSLELSAESLNAVRFQVNERNNKLVRRIRRNEQTINELKLAIHYFLTHLTRRYLSRRQALMVQYLTHISSDVERIGDHVEHLCDLTIIQHKRPDARFDAQLLEQLRGSIDKAGKVLEATRVALAETNEQFKQAADCIIAARDQYHSESQRMQAFLNDRVASHQVPSLVGMFFSDFCLTLDRLVRHCRMIAREQNQPFFSLKSSKLDRIEPPISEKPLPKKLLEGERHEEAKHNQPDT